MAGRLDVLWTRRARTRLREIRERIHEDNPFAARQWVAGVRRSVNLLCELPLSGRIVPEFARDSLRERVYGRHYRIIYRVETSRIVVVTISHTAQVLPEDL